MHTGQKVTGREKGRTNQRRLLAYLYFGRRVPSLHIRKVAMQLGYRPVENPSHGRPVLRYPRCVGAQFRQYGPLQHVTCISYQVHHYNRELRRRETILLPKALGDRGISHQFPKNSELPRDSAGIEIAL